MGGLIAFLLIRFQIDWLWFSQFNFINIFLSKVIWQTFSFLSAIVFVLILFQWQNRSAKLVFENSDIQYTKNVTGSFYLVSLLINYILISSSLILLGRLAWISLFDPFSLSYWWSSTPIYSSENLVYISVILLCIFITLLFRYGYKLLMILGSSLFTIIITRSWGLWALAISIPDSNIKEPLFNTDISFTIGKFPAISFGLLLVHVLLLLTLCTSYWLHQTGRNRISDWSAPGLSIRQRGRFRYICILLSLSGTGLLWLSRFQFLWSNNPTFTGAGWLQVNFNIPIRILATISLLFFTILILPSDNKKTRIIARYASLSCSLVFLIIEFLFSPILNWMIVRPRELTLESPYIQRSITSTRRAFQLDSIKTRLINPRLKLTKEDLSLGASTLRNLRLWDSQPLLATNRQLQQLRVYYKFSNPAVDRYRLKNNSEERQQVMITARELDQESLPSRSRTWINRHFVFTHGYGFTLSPVNTKAKDGLPDYFISDLGSALRIEGSSSLDITKEDVMTSVPIGNAAIYYGILPSPYVIAPSKFEELDYPQGDQNIFNHYSGSGGIPLRTIWQRILASAYLLEPRLLNTGSLTKDSRLLIRREIRQRIKTIAPFLKLIGEPYLVSKSLNFDNSDYSNQQNLYWIVDCYTTSRSYPYSAQNNSKGPVRYIRNSVKAIVDAYSGKVNFYISEPEDPLIKGWSNVFPNLFRELDKMPIALREHLQVPTDLFDIQVQQLLRFHVTDTRTFYNGDDVWQVPMELYGQRQIPVEPYHITAQLKDNENSEFLLLQPLSPLARPNLAAWLAARSDGENYGELVLLRFPSQTTIYGPEQIQALINQDPKISQQFSLWDRAGSEVIQGNLLVIPLGNSLLYVEPVYLKASQGGLPTLARVVVSDGNRIVMSDDLSSALFNLLEEK